MTTAATAAQRSDTRGRLLDEAMRLFAEHGFRETTVGDVEEAAGLVPRSGALYKHFESKHALLEAGVERKIAEMEQKRLGLVSLLPLGDVRAELQLIGRAMLQGMDLERDLIRILEQDGEEIPALRTEIAERLFQAGARLTAERLRDKLDELGRSASVDLDAAVAVFGGALINYRRSQWTYGVTMLELDEERFLESWVALVLGLLVEEPTG